MSEHFHWFAFDLIEKEDDVACVPDDSESHFYLVVSFLLTFCTVSFGFVSKFSYKEEDVACVPEDSESP